MNDIFLGIDIGYGNTKTDNITFSSGVKKLATVPPVMTKCVCYGGEYYAVGCFKTEIKDKFEDEDTLILTMAAIAERLKKRGMTYADVRLGLGLPLTRMGAEKKKYSDYMLKRRRLQFTYEDKDYTVYIKSVDIFPQGYAGVASQLASFGNSTVIVDMGSWTVDVLPLVDGKPDVSRCKSLPLGTITCMNDINENLRQKFGGEADENIIKEIMIVGDSDIDKSYLETIKANITQYANNIMNQLRSLKFNPVLTRFVFIGGGAVIMKNYLKEQTEYDVKEDIGINAKGYEGLIRHKYRAGA